MAETYSAGIVTAYGAAVRGGYTEAYEQWCLDMAQLGVNVAEVRTKAAQAAQSAENAAGSATAAAGSATAAASSATAASASATAAGNAQAAAETAQGKAEDAQEAAEQAQSDAEAAAQSVSQSAAQINQNASDISGLKSAFDDLVYTNQNYVKTYPYTQERYWQHGAIGQSISATARAYDKIPIVAGKTYYYRALYAYFCNIQYADGTVTAFSNNTANALAGSFTAQQDGFVYITVHTNYVSTALFTDTKEIYTYSIQDVFYTPPTFSVCLSTLQCR